MLLTGPAGAGKTIRLELPPGAIYRIERIDTWNMTVSRLPNAKPGTFSFTTPAKYHALRLVSQVPHE